MRSQSRIALLIAASVAAASCGTEVGVGAEERIGVTQQHVAAAPEVRVSELHYDNAGADAGEAIEISGPAGLDVTGWQIVLYNGNGGASYTTTPLSGTFPATCGARGVKVVTYAVNGVQNGGNTATGTDSPDGVALVNASNTVIEFLSYEGVFVAANGPAQNMTSVDIGVRELGNEPVGRSLQRSGADTWSGPVDATFGSCNDEGGEPQPEVVSVVVAPVSATVQVGGTQAFTATAFDATNQPIPNIAFSWTTSAAAIATVSATGVATGVAEGDAVIRAVAPNGVAGSASLHVAAVQGPEVPDVRFSEIHYDNAGVDSGEAIEIEGPAGADLTGWSIVLYDGTGATAYNTTTLAGAIPATCEDRGVIVVSYPSNGIQNGSPDGFALVNAAGEVVEFLSYEGAFTASGGPADGMTSTDIRASEASSSPVTSSLQRDAFDRWELLGNTFGECNAEGTPQEPGNHLEFSGRVASDPALPVGFQAQIFANLLDANDNQIPTTITWVAETPAIATVDANGVISGVAPGSASFRATAADGTTGVHILPVRIATASPTASYAGNAEFGEPTDSDPSDDFIVRKSTYTVSYSRLRNTPNWVSHNIDASAFGSEDRCNCFTFDPELPASFLRYTTADYTGSGAVAGFGIDRGHLTRSADRTAGALDNATTFYFSNIVPQTAEMNQGPWATLESDLGDMARQQNKEVYVVTGVAGNIGTLKNEGKIVIPASTWKVAVIMARNEGLADIVDYRDLEVIAVNMPNRTGIRNTEWQTFTTTVDAIETLTGYDLLALLPDRVEAAVESNTRPPLGAINGPHATLEGGTVALSAAGSFDPNGSVVSYTWRFGDGTTATSASSAISHTYAQDGTYTASVTVTDNDGLIDTVSTTVSVANVAPVVGGFAGATVRAGEPYTATGSFSDPGADVWTATVDYGDGAGPVPLALVGMSFGLGHTYTVAGTYTVVVSVSDDDVTSISTATVTVNAPAPSVRDAIAILERLVATGKLNPVVGLVLGVKLKLAEAALAHRIPQLAEVTLRSVVVDIDLLVLVRAISARDAKPLRDAVTAVIQEIAR